MDYLKVWVSFRKDMEALQDAEKGRLFDAMLLYAETGEEPDFKGAERILWPSVKQNIDRMDKRSKTLKSNGEKGGRPSKNQKKPNESKNNQTKPNETKENQTKAYKDKINIKEKEEKEEKEPDDDFGFLGSEEAEKIQADHDEILDRLKYAGFELTPALMDKAVELYAEHGKETVLEAIEGCIKASKIRLDYLLGCIRNHGKEKKNTPSDENDEMEKKLAMTEKMLKDLYGEEY